MNPWLTRSASEIAEGVRAQNVTATEVVGAFLDRIRSEDPKVHAFLHVAEDRALEEGGRVDERAKAGDEPGPLAGVPVAVKDNICVADTPTTCGSRILENYRPPYDAHVVERLRDAGAVVIGKTNLDEFAMGSSTENSAFGPTRNPHDHSRTPGGSSGGSAAAVAAGMCPLALGSDTGGSIRQPAALTGTVGFKPTYGRVSRYGLVAFASSLDQIGLLAGTVRDAALGMQTIAGHDPRDSTSANVESPDWVADLGRDLRGLRLGVPKEYFAEGLDPEVRSSVESAITKMESLGAERVEISLPLTQYGIATYYIVAPSEASSNLARYDGVHYGYRAKETPDLEHLVSMSREQGFGPEVTRRIILGTFALSSGYYDAYYNRALKARRLMARDFGRAWEKCDVIVGPTSPTPAFPLGEKANDPMAMYLCDVYTVAANLAGLPAVSVPCGKTKSGLPVGLQIQGPAFDDLRVLQVAAAFERESR